MPVHSVFVLNLQAKVLFARYYDAACLADPDERRQWERVLYRNARPLFQPALGGPPQFFEEDGAAAVVCAVNDLVLLVAGTDECDALLMAEEFLPPLQQLLRLACEKHTGKGPAAAAKGDEAAFLHADSYGKWACLLDAMVPAGGLVEHVDVDVIERLAKAKPLG